MSYKYPHIIEFIDSITNVVLILFVPSFLFLIGYIFYVSVVLAKEENKVLHKTVLSLMIISISSYFYYSLFVLDYFSLLGNALLSLLITIAYILLSPIYLVYIILTSNDIEHSLFLHSDVVIHDIKRWLDFKFGIDISRTTKDSFIVIFKLLTLLMFSTKIINVTRFIIRNITPEESKQDFKIALLIFSVFFAFYLFINQEELLIITDMIIHGVSVMLQGDMK